MRPSNVASQKDPKKFKSNPFEVCFSRDVVFLLSSCGKITRLFLSGEAVLLDGQKTLQIKLDIFSDMGQAHRNTGLVLSSTGSISCHRDLGGCLLMTHLGREWDFSQKVTKSDG